MLFSQGRRLTRKALDGNSSRAEPLFISISATQPVTILMIGAGPFYYAEAMMGVYVSYRRVPAALLDQFLASRDEQTVFTWALEDPWKPFPHTIRQLGLYNYGALHQLLNPQKIRASILWNVIEGATPLSLSDTCDPEMMYLQQIRYLTPSEVTQIASKLATLYIPDFIDPFAALWELDMQDQQSILHHPDFISVMRDYERLLCLFQIAAEVQDGIIRWYSG